MNFLEEMHIWNNYYLPWSFENKILITCRQKKFEKNRQRIGKKCRCRYWYFKIIPMPILADDDSIQNYRFLQIPMPINWHIFNTKFNSLWNHFGFFTVWEATISLEIANVSLSEKHFSVKDVFQFERYLFDAY